MLPPVRAEGMSAEPALYACGLCRPPARPLFPYLAAWGVCLPFILTWCRRRESGVGVMALNQFFLLWFLSFIF